jgi:hypothetical protein
MNYGQFYRNVEMSSDVNSLDKYNHNNRWSALILKALNDNSDAYYKILSIK